MKRNPRWMAIFVLMVVMMSFAVPCSAQIQREALRLPEGGDTIGDPGTPEGNGKNHWVPPGGYAIVQTPLGVFVFSFNSLGWFNANRAQSSHSRSLRSRTAND
ncbi:MAG: hypothetical protein ACRDL7_02260 [Gaiellaceae bacterium]